jgi:hypothetical membrane protein
MIGIYLVVAFGLMLFHSSSMTEFFDVWRNIFSHLNGGLFFDMSTMVNGAICSVALIYVDIHEEWFPKKQLYLPSWAEKWRWELTVAVEMIFIVLFGVFDNNQFIYFQF